MESFLVSFGCLSLDFHRAAKMHSMRPFRVTAFGELLPNMLPNHGLSSGHVEPGQKLLTVSGETVERGSVFRIAAELAAEKLGNTSLTSRRTKSDENTAITLSCSTATARHHLSTHNCCAWGP